jgi:hypothetical protein
LKGHHSQLCVCDRCAEAGSLPSSLRHPPPTCHGLCTAGARSLLSVCVYRADIAMMLFSLALTQPVIYVTLAPGQVYCAACVIKSMKKTQTACTPVLGVRPQSRRRENAAQKQRERCGAHAIKRWAPSPHSDCDYVCVSEPLSSGQLG